MTSLFLEYESAKLLHSLSPDTLPEPVGWGTYKSHPDSHFFLCNFAEMIEELPDVALFCAQLAKMHQASTSVSPEGKYGFHVSTYQGNMPQDNRWCDTWEEYSTTSVVSKISSGRRRPCTVVARSWTSFWSRSSKRWCPDCSAHWRLGNERSSHVSSTATYGMVTSPQRPARMSRSCSIQRHSGHTMNTN